MLWYKNISKTDIRDIIVVIIALIIQSIVMSTATIESLDIILRPVSYIVGLYNNIDFVFIKNQGYANMTHNILIAKECAGIRFFIISLTLMILMVIRVEYKISKKAIYVAVGLAGSYIMTIVANSMRIIVLIVIGESLNMTSGLDMLVHQSIGIITYLSCLLLQYLAFKMLIKGRDIDEQVS